MIPMKNTNELFIKTKTAIAKILKSRELENISAIKKLENILIENRDYVFKMPEPNTPVIMLLSGGMDSVATSFILLEKYRLNIYPVFIKRQQQRTKHELKAARYYVSKMKKKYGKLCHDLKVVEAPIPPQKIRYPLALFSNTPYRVNSSSKQLKGIPVYLLSLVAVAVQYACFLQLTKKIGVKTIFTGFVAGDGKVMAYEKELGFFMEKYEIIRWCNKNGISLESTFSCYYPFKFHCGECMGCGARKDNFLKAGVNDETIYRKPTRIESLIYKTWKKGYEKYYQFDF
jgi:7-cyano-7-deazaguanine synthase in queuosine biosynthesis